MAKFCANCGCSLKEEDHFCPNCGFKQPESFTPDRIASESSEIITQPQTDTEDQSFTTSEAQGTTDNAQYAEPVSSEEPAQVPEQGYYGGAQGAQYQNYGTGAPYSQQGQPQYVPYQPQAPYGKKKTSGAKVLWIILIAAVIIGTAAILLFVAPGFLKRDEKPEVTQTTQSSAGTQTAQATETKVPSVSDTAQATETPSSYTYAPKSSATSEPVSSSTEEETTSAPKVYSDFDYYGIPVISDFDADSGEEYVYNTLSKGENKKIEGKISITNYVVIPVTEDILEFGALNELNFTDYELRMLTGRITFEEGMVPEGEDAAILPVMFDYYDIRKCRDSIGVFYDTDHEEYFKSQITYGGKTKEVYEWYFVEEETSSNGNSKTYSFMNMCMVPEGYDGLVTGFAHIKEEEQIDYLYNVYDPFNYCLFRLK